MGLLTAGKKYTPAEYVDLTEDFTLGPGEIAEIYFDVEKGHINKWNAHQVLLSALKIKEQPDFAGVIIHYIDISENRITLQVSAVTSAPIAGTSARIMFGWTGLAIYALALALTLLFAWLLGEIAIYIGQKLGLIKVEPTGNVEVIAIERIYNNDTKAWQTRRQLYKAPFTFLGETHETPWKKEKISAEEHTVTFGEIVDTIDYDLIRPAVTLPVEKDKWTTFEGIYHNRSEVIEGGVVIPGPSPDPTVTDKAVLIVITKPVEGEIFVDGASVGVGQYRNDDVTPGMHTISCGPVEGYIPPPTITPTINYGENTFEREYTPLGFDWKKWLKWGAIGLGAILGITAIAKLVKATKGGKKE